MEGEFRTTDTCPHRQRVRETKDGQVAACGLLQEISGVKETGITNVVRRACDACCESFEPTIVDLNPIVASHLYSIAEQVLERGGIEGCTPQQAEQLLQKAENSLPTVMPDEDDSVDIARISEADYSNISIEEIRSKLPLPQDRPAKHIKRWAIGVTTAPRRSPTLLQSLRSITSAGFEELTLFVDGAVEIPAEFKHLSTCQRMPATGAFPNYMLSLTELFLRDPDADAYVLFQDDALLLSTTSCRSYLEQALWPTDSACITSLYCSTQYHRDAPGWHQLDDPWIWGAVALVFSPDALHQVMTSTNWLQHRRLPNDRGLHCIDVFIGELAVEQNIPIYFPSPSLVQHIGTISTIWDTGRAVLSRRASFIGEQLAPP